MASEDDVRRICLDLPETVEVLYEHLPGFRVKKKLFARIRQKPDALVAWRPHVDEKRELIASAPEKYFQTPHYEGHPAVLVRLEHVSVNELRELLTLSWLLNAPARLAKDFESGEESPSGRSSPSSPS